MIRTVPTSVLTLILGLSALPLPAADVPLRALLVCGGCCHDYEKQSIILRDGIQARANVQVDVIRSTEGGTKPWIPMYESADWADDYDVVIHDECAADITDPEYLANILAPHKAGKPAVNLHCAMHSYRTGKDDWFEFLGLQSTGHGWQKPIEIEVLDGDVAAVKPIAGWTTGDEELYNNVKVFETATPLALGHQENGGGGRDSFVVVWTNDYKGTRVFNTTLGHNNSTVGDARYLDMLARGLLWACDKPESAYLTPYRGPKGHFKTVSNAVAKPAEFPADALAVKSGVSSTQDDHKDWKAIDGDPETRWCAENASFPQWFQLEFDKPRKLEEIEILWESGNNAYRHVIEGSADGESWEMLADESKRDQGGDSKSALGSKEAKFVRITCQGTSQGGWASIREIKLKGEGFAAIRPDAADAKIGKAADSFAKGGNIKPRIVRLSAEEEAEIMKDVKVAEGFEASLFSTSEAANYPVYVAAAPNGDLYVSSDGNGSLGRDPNRGRVLRLRDHDGDGRADEVKEFVKNVDSPRGLVWDHDRLYLIHPPDVSVFIDHDGDGEADEEKTLIKGIAFGFADRPADHTTNGLTMGIDGWLYVAGGDFGFMDAVGTDGKRVQHRAGGVLRFRPDGSGLEIFSTGTRNILGTPVSPLLDIFARDNTNDGGGWDVRFHHFTGLDDHGYPTLYINFGGEHVKPLSDYGGGSGCGSVYIAEPGFPAEWNDAPFTCDWGTGALWHHEVEEIGATFAETEKPKELVRMTRPTDADVDGMSQVYQASWKGATFAWEGPKAGYIVRVKPQGYTPEPLPDFAKTDLPGLVRILESPSQVRTLAAQREILRRADSKPLANALLGLAADGSKPLTARVAALYAVTLRGLDDGSVRQVASLAKDARLQGFVLRALADSGAAKVPEALYAAGLESTDPRTRLEAIIGATRLDMKRLAPAISEQLGSADPVIAHTAFQSLARLQAAEACFAVIDSPDAASSRREGAAFALMRIHRPEVVDGVIARLDKEKDAGRRRDLLGILSRLHFVEGKWNGDSWGTRPDTRGPYYQPEKWSESERIGAALKSVLAAADPAESAFLVAEMERNRIESDEALGRLLELAAEDASMLVGVVNLLANRGDVPANAVPALVAAIDAPVAPELMVKAVKALARTDSPDMVPASIRALLALGAGGEGRRMRAAAAEAFLRAPKLENHHQQLEKFAEQGDGEGAVWADAGLLSLASRKEGSPEAREQSRKALDAGWEQAPRRLQILKAIRASNSHLMDQKVLDALDDADPAVAAAAKSAAEKLKIEKKVGERGPLIGELKPDEAIARVVKAKGDAELGEQVFNRQICATCHTTQADQAPKGPYLGTIAQTYTREDLAWSILDPGRTIAQGFATEMITLKDGKVQTGFITFESADEIKLRDLAGVESAFKVSDIAKRDHLPVSMMPPGLVNTLDVAEFASLLDYLESLAKSN